MVKDDDVLFLGGYRGTISNIAEEKKFDIYNTTTRTWSVGLSPITIKAAVAHNHIIYVTDGVGIYALDF